MRKFRMPNPPHPGLRRDMLILLLSEQDEASLLLLRLCWEEQTRWMNSKKGASSPGARWRILEVNIWNSRSSPCEVINV